MAARTLWRIAGWGLLALAVAVIVAGVLVSLSFANVYGWNGAGDVLATGMWILLAAAIPASGGVVILRRASRRGE